MSFNKLPKDLKYLIYEYTTPIDEYNNVLKELNIIKKSLNYRLNTFTNHITIDELDTHEEKNNLLYPNVSTILTQYKSYKDNHLCSTCSGELENGICGDCYYRAIEDNPYDTDYDLYDISTDDDMDFISNT